MHAYYRNLCKISDLSIYRTINDKEHTFMTGKAEKTNVMRILDKAEIPYQTHFYSPDTGIDAVSDPTFIDESAQLLDAICVSAGKIGAQVELAPDALCGLVSAKYAELTD